MPLPPSSIEQLAREPVRTPGWSGRLLMFTATLLFLAAIAFAGLRFGYAPFLENKIEEMNSEMKQLSQMASTEDQAKILSFYSQLVNTRKLIDEHVYPTAVLKWLESAVHPNVYFAKMEFVPETQTMSLVGVARGVKDVSEQIQIFEGKKEVVETRFSNVSAMGSGNWQFDAMVKLSPESFRAKGKDAIVSAPPVVASTTSQSTTTPSSTRR